MQLKNDNSVALERRMDLASLFCMIGRHGPAVVLTVIALVSAVVGFIIYRTVKGKWKKATAGSDSKSPGAERETTSLSETDQEPEASPEEFFRSAAESTDVRDGGLSDADLIQSDVRHRRAAAAEKKPPPPFYYYPPDSDLVSDGTHHTSAVQDNFKATQAYTEDQTNHSPRCDTPTEAEVEEEETYSIKDEDEDDSQQCDYDSCVTSEQNYREEEQILEEKCPHSENVSTENEVSEEEDFPDSTLCFEQHRDDDVSTIEEPEEVSHVCDSKYVDYSYSNDHISSEVETKNECETAECVDHQLTAHQVQFVDSSFEEGRVDDVRLISNITVGDHASSLTECEEHYLKQDVQTKQEEDFVLKEEEEEANECKEAAEECVDHQLTAQQVEIVDSLFEDGTTMLSSQHEEQYDGVIDERCSDALPSDVSMENLCEDHVSSLEECKARSLEEQEDGGVLKEETLTLCEELLSPMNTVEPEEVDSTADDALCGKIIDEKSQIADVDVPEIPTDNQQPQDSVKVKQELSGLNILCPDTSTDVVQLEGVSSFYKDKLMEHEDICQGNLTACTEVSPFQGKQSDQMLKMEDFLEVTHGDSPESIKTQTQLSSFEQNELMSFGEESGISSMTISPDPQDASDQFVMTPENVKIPVVDFPPQSENQTKVQITLNADDMPVYKEQTYQVNDECFAANEDLFGHEVEDSYQRDMEQFMAQILASATRLTTETTKKTHVKEGPEKEDDEEECEKTEISIMEATMDNNEWITDGNYQVLPWMNLSVPLLIQNHTKTNPTEEHQHCPSPADLPRTDTDITISVEAKPPDTFPLVEENIESNKKVVAVQPMPQNVNVTFRIHYLTHSPYQTVAITGDHQELGNWKGFIPLERAKDGQWATVVSLPAESHVEWKFVVLDKGEVCRWEECGNRLLDTGYGDDLLVHKWWGLL